MVRAALPILCLVTVLALPGSASSIAVSWTDDFDNSDSVELTSSVTIADGFAGLRSSAFERQGVQLSGGVNLGSPSIVQVGSGFFLYYAECTSAGWCTIALATSPDSNAWTREGVVVQPGLAGPTDADAVAYQDVMMIGSTFHMWYAGNSAGGWWQIHHASSTNGRNWTSDGVVLSGAMDGTNGATYYPSVDWDGTQFTMWYTVFNGQNTWIRRATSPDGLTWTPQGVVLAPIADGIDDSGPRMPSVIRNGSGYTMWYTCVAQVVGYLCRAASADGALWAREGVVLSPDSRFPSESGDLSQPDVLALPGPTYRLWYAARGSPYVNQIHSAVPTTSEFAHSGLLVSVPISIPVGFVWQTLSISKQEPAGTSIRVSILNSTSGGAIAGFMELTATSVSLAGLSSTREPSIRLMATFIGNGSSTALLDRWTVTSGIPPPDPFSFGELFPVVLPASIGGGVVALAAAFLWLWNRTRRS